MQSTSTKKQSLIDLRPEDHLQIVNDLTKVFPDIQDQLCSRQSTLLGKLKCTFNKLYSGFEPSYYIIVKGSTQIIGRGQDELEVSMGLQNGIIILLAKTYENNNIFLNGNHIDEELIFDCNGKLSEGLNQYSQQIQKIFLSALSGGQTSKSLYGGIIYVHANIPEGFYNYKKSLLTALFLTILSINDMQLDYTVAELIQKISQTKEVDQAFLEKHLYDYHNRHFCLTVGPIRYNIPLDNRLKLLFCRLDLAQCDISHSKKKIRQLEQGKQKIIRLLKEKYRINYFYETFDHLLQINLNPSDIMGIEGFQNKNEEEILKLVSAQEIQLKTIYEISNLQIQVQELLKIKWKIDSQLRCLYSEEVVQLVESIKEKAKIQACTIVQDEYLVLAVQKCKYSQLICILRQLLHKGELKSKSCFKLEEQLVQTRWGEENGIGEKIFVSVPSTGISIFDPSSSIWFD